MKKIGIIGAMQVEVDDLKNEMTSVKTKNAGGLEFFEGKLGETDVVIVRSGIGKVNATLCAQRLILEFGCTHIINTGIAGAMASGLTTLDFVVSSDAVYHDMDAVYFGYKVGQIPQMDVFSFKADQQMIEKAKEVFGTLEESKEHKIVEGRIATGDQFIADSVTKKKIADNFEPACVEMEGTAIAHACHVNKIPFVIIRCMSDTADDGSKQKYDFNETVAAKMSAHLVEKLIEAI